MKAADRQLVRKLGAWIYKLRKSQGVSQDALTDEAGLARGTVSKIESGRVDPKVTTLAKIAWALKTRLYKLFEF